MKASKRRVTLLGRLRVALGVGAAAWLLLLAAGLLLPGGWIRTLSPRASLPELGLVVFWIVVLVLAPLLALRDPLRRRSALNVYLIGVLGLMTGTFASRLWGEIPIDLSGGVPAAASLSAGLILWAYSWGGR